MDSSNSWKGQQRPWSTVTGLDEVNFIVRQIMAGIATSHLVQVTAVTNDGGLSPVGFVDAQVMVNQIDGFGHPTPRGVLCNVPYLRMQGGVNAVIMDPQVGDIGLAVFACRDISGVKAAKQVANPSSVRSFSLSDGLYFGGFLNGIPAQYIRFAADAIEVVSPSKVRIVAPEIEAEGAMKVIGALHVTQGLQVDQAAVVAGKVTAGEGAFGAATEAVKLNSGGAATKLKSS